LSGRIIPCQVASSASRRFRRVCSVRIQNFSLMYKYISNCLHQILKSHSRRKPDSNHHTRSHYSSSTLFTKILKPFKFTPNTHHGNTTSRLSVKPPVILVLIAKHAVRSLVVLLLFATHAVRSPIVLLLLSACLVRLPVVLILIAERTVWSPLVPVLIAVHAKTLTRPLFLIAVPTVCSPVLSSCPCPCRTHRSPASCPSPDGHERRFASPSSVSNCHMRRPLTRPLFPIAVRTALGKKFCVRTQGQRPGAADAQDAQDANWQGIMRPDDACQRTGRSERHMPRHLPPRREVSGHLTSGCEVSGHLPSGREVSGHLPSRRSVFLTDGECQGKFLPDTEGQGKCRPDDACHGICLLDVKCQGICHPDTARFIQMESVKANVVRTTRATASSFWRRSVRVFAIRMQHVSYRQRLSRQISSGRRLSRQMSSGQRMPRYLPSGCRVSRQMSSGRRMPRHLPSGCGVSGH